MSRRKAGAFRASKGKHRTSRHKPAPQPAPNLDAMLERLDEALSVIACATSAFQVAEDPTVMKDAAETGDKIACLVHGVAELRGAVREVRAALQGVSP